MRFSTATLVVLAEALGAAAQAPKPAADGSYTISAEGIKAKFIPYGASLTHLWVKGKDGKDVDVVLGYDDVEFYPKDPGHPVYNAIPGRYVNRIGKGQYKIDNTTYETEKNDGDNTLHSGTNNWSFRFFTVSAYSSDSITFTISDASNSSKGLFGRVDATITYTVTKGTWRTKILALSPEAKTPIMLTQHTYFNLDAYKDPATAKIWNHTLHLPYSKRYLEADQGALPTGKILTAEAGSINDFASKSGLQIGHHTEDAKFAGNCGADGRCEGYNGYWLIDNAPKDAVVATLASPFSGIKADLRTDQAGLVLYSCNWFDGKTPLKNSTQGTETHKFVERSSCIAIEAHDYVDGINHPEWGRLDQQLTGPGEVYSWDSSWTFSTL